MKLIIGLGNPEPRYSGTPHNIGFSVLDTYATQHRLTFQPKTKFKADIAEYKGAGEAVIFAKPTTYYNLSGESAQAIAHFYAIDHHDVMIVHDELALPFGTIRTRWGGSDAGNNGIKSITSHLGPDTARLRIGTHHERRDQMGDSDFVLSRFSQSEGSSLPTLMARATEVIDAFIADRFEATTHTPTTPSASS